MEAELFQQLQRRSTLVGSGVHAGDDFTQPRDFPQPRRMRAIAVERQMYKVQHPLQRSVSTGKVALFIPESRAADFGADVSKVREMTICSSPFLTNQ